MTSTTRMTAPPGTIDAATLALPFYEPRHAELAHRITGWCADHAGLWRDGAADPDHTSRDILRELGRAGLLDGLDGADTDLRALCVARRILAHADDLADHAFSIQTLAMAPIRWHGSPQQRARYLPGLADGTACGAFAVSEEGAGSDVAAIALAAERDDDGFVLAGRKAWIANAGVADVYCVIARTGEGVGPLGLTAFLVPGDAPGLHAEPVPLLAPRPFGHLVFDRVRVPSTAVLGRPGQGFGLAMDVLSRFRTTVGAAALGFACRAEELARARVAQRRVRGGRLADLDLVRAALADIAVRREAAALLVARAAWEIDRGNRRFAAHSSIAKLYATEAAQHTVDVAVQLFGAAGLVHDSATERLYRQVRSLRIYEGASDIQKLIIADAIASDTRR